MLTIQELNSMKKDELLKELAEARKEVLKTRMGVRTKNIKETSKIKEQKKYIARVKTIIREIEIDEIIQNANQIA